MPLFDVDGERRRPRWTGSRTLVPIQPGTCPLDGAVLVEHRVRQPALLRHGGYGATVELTVGECPTCRWSLERQRQEVRPD